MNSKDIKKASSVADIQSHIRELYPNSNVSIDYLYGYLAQTIGYLCKNISLGKIKPEHFVRPISWLIALSNKLDIDISDTFMKRFPRFCPYCLANPCICFKTKKSPVSYIPAYKVQDELYWNYNTYKQSIRMLTFDECINSINKIYPSNEIVWHYAGPWHHFVKMQEEVSEIHEAIAKYSIGKKKIEAVGEEIADTLAWILGAWAILNPSISLDSVIIDYYLNGCPVCNKEPCKCELRSNRAAELIDIEQFNQINIQLAELKKLLPSKSHEIGELQKSIDTAISSQSEPVVVQAAKQTKVNLGSIKDTLTTADDIGKKANSIVVSILSILSKLSFLT